jgi:hypothetical protein
MSSPFHFPSTSEVDEELDKATSATLSVSDVLEDRESQDFGTAKHTCDSKSELSYHRHHIIAIFCAFLTIGFFIITATSGFMNATSSISHSFVNNDILKAPCGTSIAEAKALGCHFDIITFCWLPDRCHDPELSKNFDHLSQWQWYRDHNLTQRVSKDEALTGELDGLYVSWEYHIEHCVYMWMKMHRALLGKGKRAVDGYIGPYSHTLHCGKMLLSRFELTDFNTRIRVKFPDCGIE